MKTKRKKQKYVVVKLVELRIVRKSSLRYSGQITKPETVVKMVWHLFKGLDREKLVLVGLNSMNIPAIVNVVAIGSLEFTIVHNREIMKPLLKANCGGFILLHNHPSQNPEPSDADIVVTKRAVEAGKLMGIQMLDHIVVADRNNFTSMAELGHIERKGGT